MFVFQRLDPVFSTEKMFVLLYIREIIIVIIIIIIACQWRFSDTTQLPFRALSPTQPLRTTSSRSSISFAFSFAFNPRDLYYRGYKIIIILIIMGQCLWCCHHDTSHCESLPGPSHECRSAPGGCRPSDQAKSSPTN